MTTTVVNRRHKQPYDVYVGRPSPYGNPFSHQAASKKAEFHVQTREEAIEGFRSWLIHKLAYEPDFLEPLRGKVLACWCRPLAGFKGKVMCHAQILAAECDGIEPEDVE